MCGLKTCLAVSALFLTPPPAAALSGRASDVATTFAVCTGKLSALMEHQWITDPPASDRTRQQRERMIELLDAVTRPGQDRRLLGWRVEAKVAQAQLLAQARDPAHPVRARQARRIAERDVAACTSLLLS